MNWTNVTIIILAVLFLLTILLETLYVNSGKKRAEYLAGLIVAKKFKEFDKEVNNTKANKKVNPFTLDLLKLNKALLEGNSKEIEKAFEAFKNANLTKTQKIDIYLKGFAYYISVNDYEEMEYYYEKIMDSTVDEEIKDATFRTFEIVHNLNDQYIDKLIEEIKTASDEDKEFLEFLLEKSYENERVKPR